MARTPLADRATRRQRPGGPRRWTAADKARHLAAFAARGGTLLAYCAAAGVPRATFTLWQRERRRAAATATRATTAASARRSRARATFARVEVVAPASAPAITVIVRRAGVEAEVSGLDAATVGGVVRAILASGPPCSG